MLAASAPARNSASEAWSVALGASDVMMPLPNGEELAFESERDRFLRILLHDDRNSFYVLSSDASGAWVDTALRRSQLSYQRFNSTSSYYITHNGFSDKRRKLESTRQINALFYDLDCHSASAFECRRLVAEAQRLIQKAVEQGVLPDPTMVVDSGRGLHLYYVLERSVPYRLKRGEDLQYNEKGVGFLQDVQSRLADVIDEVLDCLDGIDVDRAVFDHTRVSRIPGTYNAKAGRFAALVGGSEAYHHLSDLAGYRPQAAPLAAPKPNIKPSGKIVRFNKLMIARLHKVAELQEYRGFACEGNRELMAFVYYNTAVQVYDRVEAKARLRAFNSRFKQPLPASELDGIFSAVDNVVNVKGEAGYYVLKAESVIRLLGLTQEEMDATHFFASKRLASRLEAKRKTKEKRDGRNARIVELYAAGDMTQQQVADAVGCSVRTVASVLKEVGLTKPRNAYMQQIETASADHDDLDELRQRSRKMLRDLLDWKASNFGITDSAKIWPPCLWSSALWKTTLSFASTAFYQKAAAGGFHWRFQDPLRFDESELKWMHVERQRAVVCVEAGEVYPSIRDAARAVNQNAMNIRKALSDGSVVNGCHWQEAPSRK